MKLQQLMEGEDLGELREILLLVKHTHMPRVKAEELHQKLKNFKIMVSGKYVPANLRWVEDKLTGTLKFISADMPGSWRSGASAVSRGHIIDTLRDYGFSSARFRSHAIHRQVNRQNGPHIFFWGSHTPAPQPENFEKVWGTDEAVAAQTRRAVDAIGKKNVTEADDTLKELAQVLKFRTTGSHVSLEQAKAVHAWLKQQGYRFHEHTVTSTGAKYFKLVTLSYKNQDWRTKKGKDERIAAADKLRYFGFKVGAHAGHVKDDTDRSTLGFFQSGSLQHVVFW